MQVAFVGWNNSRDSRWNIILPTSWFQLLAINLVRPASEFDLWNCEIINFLVLRKNSFWFSKKSLRIRSLKKCLVKNAHHSKVISKLIKSIRFCSTSFNCDLKYVLISNQKSPSTLTSLLLKHYCKWKVKMFGLTVYTVDE